MIVTTSVLAASAPQVEPRDHYLVFLEGATPGLRVKLGDKPLRVGRNSANDLPVADTQVSGRHCELSLAPMKSAIRVADLGSTNGTFIEGRRIDGMGWLAPGELMRIGSQLIRHDHLSRSEAAKAEEQLKDLDKARHYVEALLPAPVTEGPVRTDWCYVPSAQLGGDAFGYHQLDERTFCGYLMDVSGHGVGAAMHSVSVMNVMRQRALPGCDFHDPAQVLRCLNDMFQMENHDGMFFSMWYGVYDMPTRQLRYASAGHHASYLLGADRAASDALRTRNMVIGAMPPGQAFTAAQCDVPEGGTLYVFSDGVFEVETPDGQQLGLPEFLPLLHAPDASARGMYETVRSRARPGPLEDDFTLLAVTFPSS
jgi:serine phosphatase RsbU (regulator of sigma subunit)